MINWTQLIDFVSLYGKLLCYPKKVNNVYYSTYIYIKEIKHISNVGVLFFLVPIYYYQ